MTYAFHETTLEHPEYEFDVALDLEISAPVKGSYSRNAPSSDDYYGYGPELEDVTSANVTAVYPFGERQPTAKTNRPLTDIESEILNEYLESDRFIEWMSTVFED